MLCVPSLQEIGLASLGAPEDKVKELATVRGLSVHFFPYCIVNLCTYIYEVGKTKPKVRSNEGTGQFCSQISTYVYKCHIIKVYGKYV